MSRCRHQLTLCSLQQSLLTETFEQGIPTPATSMLQYSMREHEEVLVSQGWMSLGVQEWKEVLGFC